MDTSENYITECPNCGETVWSEDMEIVGDPDLSYTCCKYCADIANNPQDYK